MFRRDTLKKKTNVFEKYIARLFGKLEHFLYALKYFKVTKKKYFAKKS